MVVIDTSIIIDHLRQRNEIETPLMRIARVLSKEELALSVVSVQELYEGKSSRDAQEEERLLSVITPLQIISHTFTTAQRAGQIIRDHKRKIEFADAAIAACAIINGASLYTLNTKDFIDIPGLDFYRP